MNETFNQKPRMKKTMWETLVDQAYDRWSNNEGWSYRKMLHESTPQERKAVLISNLHHQVLNGGFFQWVDNGYAVYVRDVLDVLEEIGTESSRKIFSMIEKIYPYLDLSRDNEGFGPNYWLNGGYDEYPIDTDPMDSEYYEIVQQFQDDIKMFFEGQAVLSS